MAELINLNKARKRKTRALREQQAAENRVRHGRTAAQKARDAQQDAEARRRLDQLRREPSPDPDPSA